MATPHVTHDTERHLELADVAGVDIWRRRGGYVWCKRALLKCVISHHDAEHTSVAGPFPSLADAAADVCATLQLH